MLLPAGLIPAASVVSRQRQPASQPASQEGWTQRHVSRARLAIAAGWGGWGGGGGSVVCHLISVAPELRIKLCTCKGELYGEQIMRASVSRDLLADTR